jgi:hypothetical protein
VAKPVAPALTLQPVPAASPVPLEYDSLPINQAPVIPPDEGPFYKLGKQFSLGGSNRWSGVAVVSPRAIYLLKRRALHSGVQIHFGLIGMLLASAFSSKDDTRSCDISALPPAARAALDPKGKLTTGDIIVVPREAIGYVSVGSLRVRIHVGGDKFSVVKGLFAGRAIRTFMTQAGWTLNQLLTPTAAPIHGPGFGRTFAEIEQKRRGFGKRTLFVVLALVILVIVIIISALSA